MIGRGGSDSLAIIDNGRGRRISGADYVTAGLRGVPLPGVQFDEFEFTKSTLRNDSVSESVKHIIALVQNSDE